LNRNRDVFTGRENILENISDNFKTHRIQIISALGGVGKTTTALEYAYRSIEAQSYRSVFWARADNEETLLSEFKSIAEALGLPVTQSDTDENGESDQSAYKKAVFDWLKKEENGNWLLVYDNADDSNDLHGKKAQDWLLRTKSLPGGKHGHILITSRSDKWSNVEAGCCLELPYFELEDSLIFFEKRLQREIKNTLKEEPATKLADELGHLPLALEQASAYMLDTKTSVNDYFELFKELRLSLLDKSVAGHGDYGRRNLEAREEKDRLVVGTTWTLNFNQVSKSNPAASKLLEIAAFLNPDGIPFNIFFDGAHILGGEIAKAFQGEAEIFAKMKMREMLSALTSYSLIQWRGDNSESFDMHRLVQEVIRTYHVKDRELLLGNLVICLCRIIPFECSIWGISTDWSLSDGTWGLFTKFFPHAQAVLRHAEKLPLISEPVLILYNFVADYLKEIELYQDAVDEGYLKAIAIGKQLSPETSHKLVCVNIRLADVYRRIRKFQESLELLFGITEYAEQLQQTDHGFMKAFVLKDMARIYQNQGMHAKAEEFHLKALSIVESTLNPDEGFRYLPSPFVEHDLNWDHFRGSILSSLGNCYRFCNRFRDAIEKLEKSGQIFAHIGQTHLGYLRNRYDLAKAYVGIKNFEKAEEIHLFVLTERERTCGTDHPITARSLSALGTLYRDWGKALQGDGQIYLERSIEYLERAYRINQKYVGLSDPLIEPVIHNLISIYTLKEMNNEWRQVLEEAQKECLNSSNDDTLPTHLGFIYRSLAAYYQTVKDYVNAEKYCQMAVDKDKQLRPDDFTAICESLKLQGFFHKNRADAYKESSDEEAARKHYKSAISSLEDALSYKDLKVTTRAIIYTNLGDIYKNIAKITLHLPDKDSYRRKAERNYSLALLMNIKFWGRDNIHVAKGFKKLGETYDAHSRSGKDINRSNQAEVVVELALQTYSKLSEAERQRLYGEINYTRELLRIIRNKRRRK
jgi:Tetratricopeptide repeat